MSVNLCAREDLPRLEFTLSLKLFHSSTASSKIFSCSWATFRSRVQRCQTVVMDLLIDALLASLLIFSSCKAFSSRAVIFSWKELTTDTRVCKSKNKHSFPFPQDNSLLLNMQADEPHPSTAYNEEVLYAG